MIDAFLSSILVVSEDLNMDSGTYILFTGISIALLVVFSLFLMRRIKKDLSVARHSGSDKGLMSLDRFKSVVENLCRQNTKKLKYALFRVDIRHVDEIKKMLGDDQMEAIYVEMVSVIMKLAPWGIRITRTTDRTFYVIMNINEERTIENLSQLLIENLAKVYEIGTDFSIPVVINVASGNIPEAGNNMEELEKALDITMIMSKRQGENSFVLYNVKYINENTDEYKYYHEIREAMTNKEFILHYQPIIDTNTLEVVSAEALMRWAHKTKGILPPSEFLSIMEHTGDINWVGLWCMEQMVSQLSTWQAGYEQRFTVTCNLSERQLLNAELANEIKKIVRKYKIEPNNIVCEIADIGMYNMSDIVKNNIDRISQFGVKIWLDDFGSKFSSLTALQDLPINGIKMSRGFWSRIKESSIIKNTIAILVDYAKENGLMLVAVGVEDKQEMDFLRAVGINYMQGYAFDKQKDPKDFITDVVFTPWTEDLKDKPYKAKKKEIEKAQSDVENEANTQMQADSQESKTGENVNANGDESNANVEETNADAGTEVQEEVTNQNSNENEDKEKVTENNENVETASEQALQTDDSEVKSKDENKEVKAKKTNKSE